VRAEEHKEQMAEEFKTLLNNNLTGVTPPVKIYIGSFAA
jgi:hypothetical protein